MIVKSVKYRAEEKSLERHHSCSLYNKEKKINKKITRRVERQLLKKNTNKEYELYKKGEQYK